MSKFSWTYTNFLLLHVFLAILFFALPFFSKLYGLLIPALGTVLVMKTKNKNNEVLLVVAYFVGAEVLLRMTGGNIAHEMAKYMVVYFLSLGMYYQGFSKKAVIYFVFILLLLPGVYIGANVLSFDVNVRKAILFNILGEVALFFSALYCMDRKISFTFLKLLLQALLLPLISVVVYLFLYTPSVKDVVTGTQSNFETSGGFGPNQVSTILGLAMFCSLAMLVLFSKSKKLQFIHLTVLLAASYRGIVTFSRGGVITGVTMIIVLLFTLFWYANSKTKSRLVVFFSIFILLGSSVWIYSVSQTGGLIENRYANKDAMGREKEDRLGGREEIAVTEIEMFLENPIWGIGVGKNKEYREQMTGIKAASHNEITRLLAEHGALGIVAFLILLGVPFFWFFKNKEHVLLLPFFLFWALTINHAAMRLAAPAFIYALSLLKVTINEETSLHRE